MISSLHYKIVGLLAIVGGLSIEAGCSSADAGGMGAVAGGAQDEALAKEKIQRGQVPSEADITVEGLLASHDLPLQGPPCEKALCVNSAYAIAPTLDYESSSVFVQMGLSSGISESTFKRAPLNLSVVVDRSGSMAGEKIRAVRTALIKLIDRLDDADRLSIILFDDVAEVLTEAQPVKNRDALKASVSRIFERGATNLALGLNFGIQQIKNYNGDAKLSKRVIVFTDANANTGVTDTDEFIDLARDAADDGIGLSVFGVGIDLNQKLVLEISRLRGGNYAFLSDFERISTVFDKDFDYLVTPLAYDLKFTLTPAEGYRVTAVYGLPGAPLTFNTVAIDVATVFLSRNHGAIVARLSPTGAWPSSSSPLAALSLSYTPAEGGDAQTETRETLYEGSDNLGSKCLFYSQLGVRRTVGYVNAALAEKRACSLYASGDKSGATALLDRAEDLLLDEAAATEDDGLADEAQVVTALRANMGKGTSTPYYTNSNSSSNQSNESEEPLGPCALSSRQMARTHWGAMHTILAALGGALASRRRRLQRSR